MVERYIPEQQAFLKVDIISYKEASFDKSIIFYVIEIERLGQNKWTIEKRYSEFAELHKTLKKLCGNLPNLPGKTIFKNNARMALEKRQEELDQYLKGLVCRQDCYNTEPLKQFLQVESHAPESVVQPPQLVVEAMYSFGIRDFHYQKDKGLLFVLLSEMSPVSRIDSYLTNAKMPWEKEAPPVIVTVGSLELYGQISDDQFKFEKLWNITFKSQAICQFWDQASCQLIIGLDDGKIIVQKVYADSNYIKHEEIINQKIHEKRVMGVSVDNIQNYAYTVSEDKFFKVFDLTRNAIIAQICTGNALLTGLILDKENKRCFLSNRGGNVFIYDVSPNPPQQIHQINCFNQSNIRGIHFDFSKNFLLLVGYDDGDVGFYDIGKAGRVSFHFFYKKKLSLLYAIKQNINNQEKFAKSLMVLVGKKKARVVKWSSSRQEIFVGHEDGTVIFWNAKKASQIYSLKAHDMGVCQMHYLENLNILMTASKDKKIKYWKLPDQWRDKKTEDEEEKLAQKQKEEELMVKFKQSQQKAAENSDDDDLANWHKF